MTLKGWRPSEISDVTFALHARVCCAARRHQGLISSYPRRVDLWNVYIDKETKAGEIQAARGLFERLVTMKVSRSFLPFPPLESCISA